MTDSAPEARRREGPLEVLLVEDNPGDVRLVQEAFDIAAIEVDFLIADDGAKAIDVLSRRVEGSERLPDLVLLDLNLPRMDGFDVLESVSENDELRHLPILVLTSSTDEEDVVKTYAKSANAYLTKPDSPDQLVAMARAIESFWIESAKLPTAVA